MEGHIDNGLVTLVYSSIHVFLTQIWGFMHLFDIISK